MTVLLCYSLLCSTKLSTVFECQHLGSGSEKNMFIVSKFEYQQCIESRPVQLMKCLGVSDLSGMSVSSSFVLLSETDQQNCLHASMCHNAPKTV